MNRDIVVIPGQNGHQTVIATDCSGACGSKALDVVSVSTELLAYYTARVAFMEILSVGAAPAAYTVSNFVKGGYDNIHRGIGELLDELHLTNLQSITSSETNFEMVQSAVGISVVGTLSEPIDDDINGLSLACIGSPLVGDEVVQNTNGQLLEMDTFLRLRNDPKAAKLLPVGSKGIAYKIEKVFGAKAKACDVDLTKSAGPSTCVIIAYQKSDETHFATILKDLFHPILTAK